MLGEKLAHALEEKGITVQGVNVKSNAKEAKLITPENLEIRFSKGANEEPFLSGLAETVKRFTGEQRSWSAFQTRAISKLRNLVSQGLSSRTVAQRLGREVPAWRMP